jgi:2-polyprenyl-3-methyl-5-hydroxy-6-metoxy-1,4-benzoquinol methylase
MAENRLNIITVNHSKDETNFKSTSSSRLVREKELQAKFERLWLLDPEQFNPLRNCMQKERLERTWKLLKDYLDPANQFIADIGCGAGVFSRRLRDAGAKIEAADIAENALKYLREHDINNIQTKRTGMPITSLPDQAYDTIICTEVVAYLYAEDFRLFFSELARLIKPEGHVICSSPIDIYTEGGKERLLGLAQTEFIIIESVPSYHALHIRLKDFFKAPLTYVKGWKDPKFRQKEIKQRSGLSRFWFRLNSTVYVGWVWTILSFLVKPILFKIKNSRILLLTFEKICRFFWDEAGISHLIFIAKRRPLEIPKPNSPTIERPKRKEIWE